MMQLNWIKSDKNTWLSFDRVDLGHSHFDDMEGVYVIFRGDGPTIRVGQGTIRERITEHRQNPLIQAAKERQVTFATWAVVPDYFRDGVEAFLAEQLTPLVGERFPDVPQIQVNLPVLQA